MPDSPDLSDLPGIAADQLHPADVDLLAAPGDPRHPPRILLLYGSLRAVSYSRKAAEEAARVLRALGCETRIFDPSGLPLPDDAGAAEHPKVAELRELAVWSEGMVWSSPERHGAMTGIMKLQIDWLPLSLQGGIRTTQGKTLAVMQVSGGSQSFNAVNQMRILGRWMRMLTIPNQSSIPKAWLEFEEGERLPDGPFYRRLVDVMEELVKFTWLVRGRKAYLVDRYSERVESAEEVHRRVSQK
ncbi:arsenical resistance protein ArsH [Leisingera sp. S132]|uniref:arsenical resistance protein ArsH n=1 Tax=Leisingera sp. S132 TaxID=2867016 RepID=UPI002201AE79|nr:arsenical resistance protein ArsH [Leisingera sp. S132]UWQ78100.1 arsenical resistance protein ArsH [Leisingera sp. S132]